MRVFLKERLHDDDEDDCDEDDNTSGRNHHDGGDLTMLAEPILRDAPTKIHIVLNTKYSSLKDMVSLIKNRYIDKYIIFAWFHIHKYFYIVLSY